MPAISHRVGTVTSGDLTVSLRRGRPKTRWQITIVAIAAMVSTGCDVDPAIERLSEARLRSADLHVQFTTAADAANRAVMADTDEASVPFAREAEAAKQAVQTNIDALEDVVGVFVGHALERGDDLGWERTVASIFILSSYKRRVWPRGWSLSTRHVLMSQTPGSL
jgi:hypothetical protein